MRELPERWALVRRAVFADKGKSHHTTTFGLLLLLLSWLAIWFGHTSVLALIIGILVLDLTVQGVHITNQTVIYRIHPDARNRLTAGYMIATLLAVPPVRYFSLSLATWRLGWRLSGWRDDCPG
ncbi:transporter ygaY [Escherichia coli]|uniref:Transporter ygaY n=1 Tax=Escherichia coli TaxID=562 RepID=A0A376UEF2_ECOLX|nr:transporter ygaY [Escherichia coli]